MEGIHKKIDIGTTSEVVFQKFVNEMNEWWPKAYTWSQDKLNRIGIDAKKDGLCTEIGPNGFRCDWGRVTEFSANERIGMKWQISQKREPIPDPDKASDITIDFVNDGKSTIIHFRHFNFENHGEGSGDYMRMMDSEYGWDYILNLFKTFCEKSK